MTDDFNIRLTDKLRNCIFISGYMYAKEREHHQEIADQLFAIWREWA